MSSLKVSIVVAVYNGASTLSRCLSSLIDQTYENIEIICVNDCSTDNSLEILQEYAKKYRNINIINHVENRNGGGADNTGIKAGLGHYICIVDQDDTLEPDAIKILVDLSDEGKHDIILGQRRVVKNNGKSYVIQTLKKDAPKDENVIMGLLNGVAILGGLFNKKLYFQNDLFYPEKIGWADNAIYNAILIAAESIKITDNIVYNYYADTENSLSKQVSLKSIIDRIKTTDLCYENCKRIDKKNYYSDAIAFRYLDLTSYTITLLTYVPYNKTRDIVKQLEGMISKKMPNKYFDRLSPETQWQLKNVNLYLKREHRKRQLHNVKVFFHNIRHNIAIFVKKALGMNPKKSLFKK